MALFNGRIHRNPKRYSNPHELARAIDMYVEEVQSSQITYKDKKGEDVTVYLKKPSIPGLCLFLGMSSKRALVNLATAGNKQLLEIVETSFLWIETAYVEGMLENGANVAAFTFLLTNMGYKKGDNDKPALPSPETVGQVGSSAVTHNRAAKIVPRDIQINLVQSPESLPDDVVRQQLIAMGGDDSSVLQAIDEEFALQSGSVRTISANVTQSQPDTIEQPLERV